MTRDECLIQSLAIAIGCKAVIVRGALDLADYPAELLAARRIALLSAYHKLTPEAQEAVCEELAALDVAGQDDSYPTTSEIAVNVAAYNVAHVSDKNKAWAERRLQEELDKGGDCHK